jgi:disease resistance protein RPM1
MHGIRRISLHDKVDGNREDSKEEQIILPTTVSISQARSLVVLGNAVQLMPPLSWFSVLRVLCLKNVPSKVIHPKDLGSLHHLRYLELGGEVEPGLLEGIGNLKLLKTLDLWGPSIEELPTSIIELQGLEHLIMDERTGLKLPDGIGNLTSLQELSGLDVNNSPSTLTELGKLTELRTLAIKGLGENESYMKTFLQSLSNLGNLRTLEFYDGSGGGLYIYRALKGTFQPSLRCHGGFRPSLSYPACPSGSMC